MRDLFSQCMCIRTYMSVMLRNVNLRSPTECQFALTLGQDTGDVHYTRTSGRCFLVMEDGEGTVAGPSQRMYLWSQVHKQVLNTANGW